MGLFSKTKQPDAPVAPDEADEAHVDEKEEAPMDDAVPASASEKHHPDDHDEGEDTGDDDSLQANRATEWDEGGPSHCGYHETVHATLMAVGGSVHKILGSPPEPVEGKMNLVSNWFQEASYAIRDFVRGKSNMTEDVHEIMSTIMSNSQSKDETEEHPPKDETSKPAEAADVSMDVSA